MPAPPLPLPQELLTQHPEFVQPESRRNEVLGWVKEGVRDFSISRAAVEWGIPVPRDPRQTVYVWFDALNGYLSGEGLVLGWVGLGWSGGMGRGRACRKGAGWMGWAVWPAVHGTWRRSAGG